MSGCANNRLAAEGDTVLVHYTGTLQDGTEFDSSRDGDPLEFTLGAGQMISGFEDAIYGMKIGQTKTVTLAPEEAYGPYRDDLLIEVDLNELPEGITPEVGAYVTITYANGTSLNVPIVEVTEKTVTLDTNHPLAGKDLTFEITLVDIR